MNPCLIEACDQADNRIAAVLGSRCPAKSALSRRGTVANPAPRVLKLDGQRLADVIDLSGSWFQSVEAEGGYLNFTLSAAWYQAAVEALPAIGEMGEPPVVPVDFSARIDPWDWHFWKALRGKVPDPAIAARQDRENPGWLARYTVQRLADLEPQAGETPPWTEEQKGLMLALARYPQGARPQALAVYLDELSRKIWEIGPGRIPAALNRHCRRILTVGRMELGGQAV